MAKLNHTLPSFKTNVHTAVNLDELKMLQTDNPSIVGLGEAPLLDINPKTPREKGNWVNLDMKELSQLIQKRYQSPEDLADEFTQSIVNFSKRTYAVLFAGVAGVLTFGLTKSSFPNLNRLKLPAVLLGLGAFFLNSSISNTILIRKLKYLQMKPFLDAQASQAAS